MCTIRTRTRACTQYFKPWPEQGNKYNILHIKVSLEAIFLRNYLSKQKSFHLSARELHNECSAFISVKIICFEHLQQISYEKLKSGIFLWEYVQPNASQVATMMALWKVITVLRSLSWNFSSHITSHILFAKAFKNLRRKWLRKFRLAT